MTKLINKSFRISTDFNNIDFEKLDIGIGLFVCDLPTPEEAIETIQEIKKSELKLKRVKTTEDSLNKLTSLQEFYEISFQDILNLVLYKTHKEPALKQKKSS